MADEFDEIEAMFDDDSIPGIEDPSMDPDNVSSSVVGDVTSAIERNASVSKLSNSFRRSVTKTLPGTLGRDIDGGINGISDLAETASDVLDKTSKVAGKSLKNLSTILPDFIADPVKRMGDWLDDSESYSSGREQTEDERILEQVAGIFGEKRSAEAKAEQVNNDVKNLMTQQSNELLARIVTSTTGALHLKESIDLDYYRKDLELQLKQTATLVKIFDVLNSDSKLRTAQLEAIVKNTALPDFAKTRGSDFVKQMMINEASDVSLEAFKSSNIVTQATKNITNLLNDKVSSFISGTEMLDGFVETKNMMREAGITSTSLLLDTVLGEGMSKLTDGITEQALEKLLSNDDGIGGVNDVNKFMSDPEEAIKYLYNKSLEENGEDSKQTKAYDFLKDIVKGGLTKNSYNVSKTSDLKEATYMDGKLKQTIHIIPDILTKILAEVTTIRKGKKVIDGKDQLSYNYRTNTYENRTDKKRKLVKELRSKGDRLAKSVDDDTLIKSLTGDKDISLDTRKNIVNALTNYLLDGKSPSPYFMKDNGFLEYFSDNKAKSIVDSGLKTLTEPKTKEEIAKTHEVKDKLASIQKSNISSYKDVVDRLNDTTDNSLISEVGLTTKKDPNSVTSDNINKVNKKFATSAINKVYKQKDVKLKKEEAEEKTDNDGYFVGGYTGWSAVNPNGKMSATGFTGTGDRDSKRGPVHANEYVLNTKTLSNIIADVKSADFESISQTVTNIAKDVATATSDTNTFKTINKNIDTMSSKVNKMLGSAGDSIDKKLYNYNVTDSLKAFKPVNKLDTENMTFSTKPKMLDAKDIFTNTYKDLSDSISSLILSTSVEIDNIKTSSIKYATDYMERLPNSWSEVNDVYEKQLKTIKDNIPSNMDELSTSISSVFDSMSTNFSELGKYIPDSIKELGTSFSNDLKDLHVFGDKYLPDSLKSDKIEDTYKDVKKDITSFTSSVTDNITDVFKTDKRTIPNLSLKPMAKDRIDVDKKYTFSKGGESEDVDYITKLTTPLTDAFSRLTDSLNSTIDDVTEDLDNNIKDSTSKIPKSFSNFGTLLETVLETSNSEFAKGLFTFNKENTDEKLKEDFIEKDDGIESENKPTFIKSAVNSIKNTFSTLTNDTPEFMENIKEIGVSIDKDGIDSVIMSALAEESYPRDFSDSVHKYKAIFNSIDPTGELWKKVRKEKDLITNMEKLHIKVLEDKQKGLLGKAGDKVNTVLNNSGTMLGGLRTKLINSVPEPFRGTVEGLLDNRLTKYTGKTLGRIKRAGIAAGKTTLNELKVVGREGLKTFVDEDGRVHMPSAVDLAKFAGNTYMGSVKALAKGVKEFHPEVLGAAGDIAGLGVKSSLDFLGISRKYKRTKNRLKAFIKPPIERKLYKAWVKGDLTGQEVLDALDTDESKEAWTKWLKETTKINMKGFTLPEILMSSGKAYKKAVFGTADVIKPTYSTIGKATGFAAKHLFKAAWKFSGIPDAFSSKKNKQIDNTYISIISDNNLSLFQEDIEYFAKSLNIDGKVVDVLNEKIGTLKKKKDKNILSLLNKINTNYSKFRDESNLDDLKEARSKVSELLSILNSLKPIKKKDKKVKVNNKVNEQSEDIVTSIKEDIKKTTDKKETIIDEKIDSVNKTEEKIDDLAFSTKDLGEAVDKLGDEISKLFSSDVKEKTEPMFAFNDTDKDGDRDGNREDRLDKLYSKDDKKKEKTEAKIIKPKKDSSMWKNLVMFAPLLISGLGTMFGKVLEKPIKLITTPLNALGSVITGGMKLLLSPFKPLLTGLLSILSRPKNIMGMPDIDNIDKDSKGKKSTKGKKPKVVKKGVITQTLRNMKAFILKKFGKKTATKLIGKIASRFVPGVGQLMLGWDAIQIAGLMMGGYALKNAVSKQILGIDVFGKDDVDTDDVKDKQVDLTKTVTTEPANNVIDKETIKQDTRDSIKKEYVNNPKYKQPENTGFFSSLSKSVTGFFTGEDEPKDSKVVVNKVTSVTSPNVAKGNLYDPENGRDYIKMGRGVRIDGLNPTMRDNLYSMANEYHHLTGKSIILNSAYRSRADQIRLRRKYGTRAARPGSSTHEYGLAFDTNTTIANELDKLGLMKKYGFTRPVGKETWHVEPAGIQLNINRSKQDPRFATALIKTSIGRGGTGWALNKKARKSSRNLEYQRILMSKKGLEVKQKDDIIKQIKADDKIIKQSKHKTLLDKVDDVKSIKSKHKESKTITPYEKEIKNKVQTKKPSSQILRVDTKHLDTRKELKELHTESNRTNDLLDKSLKVQMGMYDKLSELVTINKGMLDHMVKMTPNQNKHTPSNKTNYNLGDITPGVDHSVKNF